MKILAFATLIAAVFIGCTFADCSVSITQTLGSRWVQNGVEYSQWNAQITAGSQDVTSLLLSANGPFTQLWELTQQSNGLWALPDWRLQNGGIPAGQSHQFGYIWESSSMATFNVSSINCGTPASPSGSPQPASPSPSASASPTIVSTPQPSASPSPASGCSVTFSLTARSASAGGSWTQGNFQYQIWDLIVTNNGNRPATNIQLNINIASDQAITQFWNLLRTSDTSFTVTNVYGPLQPGSNIGTGFVVQSPLSNTNEPAPSVSVQSVTCSGGASSPSASPTIVSTPQPSQTPSSGCSASVFLAARSASAGGVWQSNGQTFQIFDITITNTGQRPINGGILTFTLPASGAITQWWELNRQDNTNVFNVSFSYGPLQVGASQGAGIVVSVPGSNPPAAPGYTLSSLSCQ